MRIGHGIDVHRLVSGGPLHLACVEIAHPAHLEGHSDGDVAVHAIADALLSAGGVGDLGTFFPASDEQLRGISGREILQRTALELTRRGVEILDAECTIVCDSPHLAGHTAAMTDAIANALGISPDSIRIKPRHAEGLGFAGKGEGIVATSVVLVKRS